MIQFHSAPIPNHLPCVVAQETKYWELKECVPECLMSKNPNIYLNYWIVGRRAIIWFVDFSLIFFQDL